MAAIAKTSYELPKLTYKPGEKSPHDKAFEDLMQKSLALPEGEIIGGVLSFPYADGYAHYLVIKDKPLTLQHIPYSDAWELPEYQLRGLRRAEIVALLERARARNKLFSK